MKILLILLLLLHTDSYYVPYVSHQKLFSSSHTSGLRSSLKPSTSNEKTTREVITGFGRLGFLISMLTISPSNALEKEESNSILEGLYTDPKERFVVVIPPAWLINPKRLPRPDFAKFQTEESLLTATCFAEGASLGITSTQASRLLKDFEIDWWFAPIQELRDVGPPELISKLLILQRQGEFESRNTNSVLVASEFNEKKEELSFTFDSPISEGVFRRTIAKTVLRNNLLYTVWVSALKSVFDSDYGSTLENIRVSFLLS